MRKAGSRWCFEAYQKSLTITRLSAILKVEKEHARNGKLRVTGGRKATDPTPDEEGKDRRATEGKEMKFKLPLSILILVMGVVIFAARANASGEGVFYLSNLSQIDLSFTDLDARDADNNPVNTPKNTEQLQGIFQAGLYELLTQADLYSVAAALSAIKKKLNLASQTLTRALPQRAFQIICALLPVKKSWENLLVTLAGFFAFILVISNFAVLSTCITPDAKSSLFAVLRL
jgi:hypothetical protein